MLRALLFVLALSSVAAAEPPCDQTHGDPAFKCLPDELPVGFAREPEYFPFEEPLEAPPLIGMMDDGHINGLDLGGFSAVPLLNDVFGQDHWVKIPEGQQILERQIRAWRPEQSDLPDLRRVWEYPVGLELAHGIYWNTVYDQSVFEVRLMRLLPSRRWAMGVYFPDPENPKKLLLRKSAPPLLDKTVLVKRTRGAVETAHLRFVPMQPDRCRDCHQNHGSASWQYGIGKPEAERIDFQGPCGFNPELPEPFISRFKDGYAKKHGIAPVRVVESSPAR